MNLREVLRPGYSKWDPKTRNFPVDFFGIPATLGYNRGMKSKNDDIILAAIATSPIVLILGVIICYNLPTWMG